MTLAPETLTAYALNELDPTETAAVEAQLAADPAAREYVAQVRATAATLTDALRDEPAAPFNAAPIEHRLAPQPLYRFRRLALAASILIAVGITIYALMPLSSPPRRTARQMSSGSHPIEDIVHEIRPTPEQSHTDLMTFPPAAKEITPLAQLSPKAEQAPAPTTPAPTGRKSGRANPKGPNDIEWRGSTGWQDNHVTFEPNSKPDTTFSRDEKTAGYEMARTKVPAATDSELMVYADDSARERAPYNHRQVASGSSAAKSPAESYEFRGRPIIIYPPPTPQPVPPSVGGGESYDYIADNPFIPVGEQPLSTFSIDVDTASYANVRRMLNQGQLPSKAAVRIEEFINYFDYEYSQPTEPDHPFAAHVEIASAPWQPKHRLVKIGLKGREIEATTRPAANLVFLIDVSGSMRPANKLPLVQQSLKLLVEQLDETDRVAIVTYAGNAGIALQPTLASNKAAILAAIDSLQSGGSTHGSEGILTAYQLAEQYKTPKAPQAGSEPLLSGRGEGPDSPRTPKTTSRVILATDGDFNVGVTDRQQLIELIEAKAKSGIFLSVLGYGMGNLKDAMMEALADKGNGNYAYIDTLSEAKKVLVDQMGATLVTIAKDVKIQVEFNPALVHAYRLIGYENRMLRKEDFNDDTKDAGEIGAGHQVTALYEVVPVGAETPQARPAVDPLKYQSPETKPQPNLAPAAQSGEMLTLKLRYKKPDGDTSTLRAFAVTDAGRTLDKVSDDFRFAAAVAGFGMILRDSPHKGDATFASILDLAAGSIRPGVDKHGYRAEFLDLVRKASALKQPVVVVPPPVEPQPIPVFQGTVSGINLIAGDTYLEIQIVPGQTIAQGATLWIHRNGTLIGAAEVMRINANSVAARITMIQPNQSIQLGDKVLTPVKAQ